MADFRGVGVALVTPFTSDGKVDFEALKRLLQHTAKGGVSYYVVHGTTGESITTTGDEKQQILDFILENNEAGLPVVYGLGGSNTQTTADKLKKLNVQGVDAILSVSPSYNLPTQEGIYQHFMQVADAAPAPVILYNVPGRTGKNIAASTTLRLAQHENIIGIKEASHDLMQCAEIVREKPQDFKLISGDDLLTVPTIAVGGVGVISVLANAFPATFCSMVKQALEGNYEKARQEMFKLIDINKHLYTEGNPVGIKQALKESGICEPYVRLPLVQASEQLAQTIQKITRPLLD